MVRKSLRRFCGEWLHLEASDRYYSTSNSDLQSSDLPLPVLTINNLNDKDSIKSYRILLKDKGGIYSFINTVNGNQYIGSAKDFYLRLNEHLENKESNLALQKAFAKYGLASRALGPQMRPRG